MAAPVGFAAWSSAGYLLCTRYHYIYQYEVRPAVPVWNWHLLLLFGIGAILALGAWQVARGRLRPPAEPGARGSHPAMWLLACGVIPLAEQLRHAIGGLPQVLAEPQFVEPLWFAFASGMAAWGIGWRVFFERGEGRRERGEGEGRRAGRFFPLPSPLSSLPSPRVSPWFLAVFAVTLVALGWWFYQGHVCYTDYVLGFPDFGIYARRVINTWEGRGLLSMAPGPPFVDHFYPGLILLVPLWGLWPDVHLFLFVQAFCLALPAVFVYGIARRLGAQPAGAAAWGGAYLAFPAVGQLNLNMTYGMHEVTLALPTVMAALWATVSGRRTLALGLALLACTFKESIPVVLSSLALTLAILGVLEGRKRGKGVGSLFPWRKKTPDPLASRDPQHDPSGDAIPTAVLSPRGWVLVSAGFALVFLLIGSLTRLIGPATTWRFQSLGATPGEVLLSPLLNPQVFWGHVFQAKSFYYLLSLLVPAGLISVVRGWPLLLSLIVPLGVLLAWDFEGATCIGMQYVTELIPLVFAAAMIGAVRGVAPPARARAMFAAGLLALASGLVASFYLGALPYSRRTITDTLHPRQRIELAGHHAVLNRVVGQVGDRDASTLASARLAAHLLKVRRLDTVFFALVNEDLLTKEAGPDRRWIELFDWVALDLTDRTWNNSLDDLRRVADAAEAAGYHLVTAEDGVLVYRRPVEGQPPGTDPLARWRISQSDARQLAQGAPAVASASGICIPFVAARPVNPSPDRPWKMEVRLVLQALEDHAPEYRIQHLFSVSHGNQEQIVGATQPLAPVGGNRPTSWWKKGEAWFEHYTVEIQPGVDPAQMRQRWEFQRVE